MLSDFLLYVSDKCFVDLFGRFSETSCSLLVLAAIKFSCYVALFRVCRQRVRYIISEFMLMYFQIYNKKFSKGEEFYMFRKNVETKKISEVNFEVLKRIISDNAKTEYGILHNFSKINSVDDFRKNVDLSDYYGFEKYVNRMYNGEENVLTAYPVEIFVNTSGTTNKPKIIPVTRKSLSVCADACEKKKNDFIKKYREENGKGSRLFVGLFCDDLDKPHERCMLYTEIYYRYHYESGYLNFEEYVGGRELMFDKGTQDVFYAKLWSSLLDENVILIESIYMYDVLQFLTYFENNYEKVIFDIRRGIIPKEMKISDRVRKKLLSLPVDFKRLDFVERECKKGFDGIVSRVWPKINLVSGISSKSFVFENRAMERYLHNVPKDFYIYGMSESYIGASIKPNSFEYSLLFENAFYEFIPCSKDCVYCGDAITIDKLEVGKLYELVLTSFSGFYRYKTGDMIKIKSCSPERVTFEFVLRKNLLLNIAGEKMTACNIGEVVRRMDKEISDILAYSFGAMMHKNVGRYFMFLCFEDSNVNINTSDISNKLDLILSEVNCVYKKLRYLGYISSPKVILNNSQEYSKLIDKASPKRRHNKPIHILSEVKLNAMLR